MGEYLIGHVLRLNITSFDEVIIEVVTWQLRRSLGATEHVPGPEKSS